MAEDPVGSQISYVGGRLQGLERCARGPGTSVELWELFAQQPARRAFLPGPRSERAALTRVAADAVLARPDVGLRLELEGRVTLRHDPAAADSGAAEPALREAWASVFGAEPAERAIWWAGEDAELRVEGLAGAPRDGRRGREGLRLFVNGRPVRDRSLAWALQEAYRGWLPAGRFPLVVARLSAPPDQVDVNVHPTKAEVQPARAGARLQPAAAHAARRPGRTAIELDAAAAPARPGPRMGAAGGRRGRGWPDRAGRGRAAGSDRERRRAARRGGRGSAPRATAHRSRCGAEHGTGRESQTQCHNRCQTRWHPCCRVPHPARRRRPRQTARAARLSRCRAQRRARGGAGWRRCGWLASCTARL